MKIQEMMLQRISEIEKIIDGINEQIDPLKKEKTAIRQSLHVFKTHMGIETYEGVDINAIEEVPYCTKDGFPEYGENPSHAAIRDLDQMREEINKNRHIHIPHSHNAKNETLAIRKKVVQILQENEDSLNPDGVSSEEICEYVKEELNIHTSRCFSVKTLYYHLSFLEKNGIIERDDGLWKLKENV